MLDDTVGGGVDAARVGAAVALEDDGDDTVAAVTLALPNDGGGDVGSPRKIGFILEERELLLVNTRR